MDIPLLSLVEIRWDDASTLQTSGDWQDPADVKPSPQLATTVGFLVAMTDKHVVIAHTFDGHLVNGTFQIPRAMMQSIKPIRKKRKPKVTQNAESSM